MMKKRRGILKSLLAIVFGALVVSSVPATVATWNAGGGKTPVGASANASTPTVANPVCYNASTGIEYPTIWGALQAASSGQYIYQYIGTTATETKNLTINSGVHLVLPFAGKATKSDTTSPIYDLGSDGVSNISNYGSNAQGDTSARVATYRKCLLNMREGADIDVKSGGYLHIGGVFNTGGNRGYYSEINLGSGSSIECSGTFDCYGYVKENYQDAVNPIKNNNNVIDNSSDAGRGILMKNGSTLNSFMAMYDALSGGGLATCIQDKKYCPFWTYDFPAMQTYTTFQTGSTFKVGAIMTVGSNVARGTGTIISSSSGLFVMSSGTISMEYCPSTANYVQYTTGGTKTNMIFDGSINLSSLSISVSGYSINTSDFFLPISYKQSLYITNGATVNLNSKVKFLNESALHIKNGGTLNVNHQTIFYSKQAVTLSGSTKYTHNNTDALLDNNGTIVVNNNNSGNGKLGAYISHTNTENTTESKKGKIDLSKATSGSLTVTAIEDGDNHEVTVKTKALFIVNDNDHTQGTMTGELSLTKTYLSGYDSSFAAEERYYWIGEFVSTVDVVVTVEDSTYRFPFKYYTLKTNTSASATGAETLADSASTSQTYTIQGGLYINFSAPNVANVAMTINGSTTSYNASSWFKITSGAVITVTPSQGYKIKLTTTGTTNKVDRGNGMVTDTSVDLGTSDNTDSGRGTTTVQILASTSSSSGFSVVAEGTGDCTIILAGNQYYRLYCSQRGTNSSLSTIQFTGKYYDYDAIAGTGQVKEGFDLASTSNRDANTFTASTTEWRVFTFGFKGGGGSCLLPGTLITMADGSLKAVSDIQAGDMVKVFNHETGEIDVAPITFNDHDEATLMRVMYCNFSNGKSVGVIYEHGFFDLDTMRYEYIREDNYFKFVGHRFYTEEGGSAILTSVNIREEYTECYSPTSFFHFDYFTEGMLSMPGGITGLFNIFEYGEDLKYDEEAYNRDIEMYGLFTYEDLAPLGVTEIMFEAYAGKYLKVALGKGILTEEYLEYLIERYGGFTEEP